jgi:hypothetical protein
MKSILYRPDALIITIPCPDPAAAHSQLLQSITANMKYSAGANDKSRFYHEEVLPLINLLKVIIPGEEALMKAYQ